jgi:hypothetical protein
LLADYVSMGFEAHVFWKITLREYNAHMSGANRRLDREHRERAWLAHTTAALSGISGKDFPQLEDLINPKEVRSEDRLFEMAQQWDAAIKAQSA